MLDFIYMRLFIILFILALASPTCLGKEALKFGMSAPLSGPAKQLGAELLDGIRPAFEDANREGGVNGRPIELIVYDDQYKPELTLKNTLKLLRHDHVDALFSFVGTATVVRILPLLRLYDTTALYFPFTGAQTQRIAPYSQFVRNFRASYYDETASLVNYFVRQGKPRIAVFYQIDAYGRNGWYGVKLALRAHNRDIVSEATYTRGAPFTHSFLSPVNLILAGKPDAIIVVGTYQAAAGFIRDLRTINTTIPVANISFVGAEALIQLLAPVSHGTSHLLFSHVVPNPMTSQTPAAKDFRKRVTTPSFAAFEGFLNTRLLVEIYRNPTAKKFDIGLDHPVVFNQDNDVANTVYLSNYTNGQWLGISEVSQ